MIVQYDDYQKKIYDKILNLIHANIDNPLLDIDFLCKHAGISRTQLYRIVKVFTNESVYQLICSVRLNAAIKVIQNENCSFSEAAIKCGFINLSVFSKAFKRKFGMSPSAYFKSLAENKIIPK
jgi:AraC-like DNA-binding protein